MTDPAAAKSRRGMLGQRLVGQGLITDQQLVLALRQQKRTGGHLGEVLVSLGFVSKEEISAVLAEQAGVEEVDLTHVDIPPDVLALLDESFCRQHSTHG